jgi:chorismate dehydratase
MLHGPQRDAVAIRFETPSACARAVELGDCEIGLVPVAEIARQHLEVTPGYGIASHGAVRSILLVSRVPLRSISRLAADSSSRTSVELARVILREMYGATPEITPAAPHLESMLETADAAVLIGDAALQIDPYTVQYEVLDLGAEWYALTGLPMVFALWAGKPGSGSDAAARIFESSYTFGREHIDDIVKLEYERRNVDYELAYEYLTRYIRFEIGEAECRGLETFLQLAQLPSVDLAVAEAR